MALGTIGEDDERMRENERMRELRSEEKKEKREVFVEKKEKKKKIYGEYEEIIEMKRMKKKRKWLVTVGKNEKARTHLMAKLCVVLASPLNYV